MVSSPDVISPSSNPSAAPSASIVPTHFPHKPPSAAPVHPFIDTAKTPLNAVPIELDSTPVTSPVAGPGSRMSSWKTSAPLRPGQATSVEEGVGVAGGARIGVDDQAVLDGPMDVPDAQEFEAVKDEQGQETPVEA
jgi:hypothetical protein